jgi:hypothetical protein
MPIWLPIGRNALPDLFAELGYKVGAEIGVAKGAYSEILCKAGLKVYAVDAYTPYRGYRWHTTRKTFDALFEEARDRLAPYDHQIIRGFSTEAVKLFADNSLDFVYIDGNHEFQQVTNDIAEWSKKVRPGGIVSGHDFQRHSKGRYVCHVKDVVLAWTYSHRIRPWFVTKKRPSWFWVKGGGSA